jgi:hypothetical protein
MKEKELLEILKLTQEGAKKFKEMTDFATLMAQKLQNKRKARQIAP